jgi:hypothetical protein
VSRHALTSATQGAAVQDAHKYGVRVQVMRDKVQRSEQCSSAAFLANQECPR